MATARKVRGPYNRKDNKGRNQKKKPKGKQTAFPTDRATVENYGRIARLLKVSLNLYGPNLSKQLKDKKLNLSVLKALDSEKDNIDFLYTRGYNVEALLAEYVGRIQDEIVNNLPF